MSVPVFQWRKAIRGQLTATQHHIALHLSDWMDVDGTNGFPTTETLAETCGRKRDTVEKAIRGLVDAGWLTRERKSRRAPCVYETALPSGYQLGSTESTSDGGDSRDESTPFSHRVDPVGDASRPPSGSESPLDGGTTSPYQHLDQPPTSGGDYWQEVIGRLPAGVRQTIDDERPKHRARLRGALAEAQTAGVPASRCRELWDDPTALDHDGIRSVSAVFAKRLEAEARRRAA